MTQFEEKKTQVLGLSVDSMFALKTWAASMGGIRHPLLADFWPHGAVAKSFGVFNEEGGFGNRSTFIIGPDGVVRKSELYKGTLPDVSGMLAELDQLQA